jgi:UDP-GlcNAc:undecaprenyl-phosphate GlcNAc-1-phosphate transferase
MAVLALLAFVLTLLAVPLWIRLADRFGLIDAPDDRKLHDGLIPSVGGLAIFTVFIPLALFGSGLAFQMLGPLLAGVIILLVLGAIDDAKPVYAPLKFALHFLAAILIVWPGGAILYNMGNLFGLGPVNFGWFAPIFSVFCGVYMINALNMMDGMDGLAGGLSFVITGWLLFLTGVAGYTDLAACLAILLACIAGFLAYNLRHPFRKSAAVFLGDAGSMALGLCITWAAIHLSQGAHSPIPPISYAFIVALPIWDAFGLLVKRLKEGRHPFSPDRGHFHHHFLEAGFTPTEATPIILSYAAFIGAVGVALPMLKVPEVVLTVVWVALWAMHTYIACRPQGFINALRKSRSVSL